MEQVEGGDGGLWRVAPALVVGVALLLGWLVLRRGRSSTTGKLPPGSLGWPVLGETLEFMKYAKTNDWTGFHNRHVAKYGQIFKTNVFLKTSVPMPPPEGNKYLFTNENKTLVGGAEAVPPSIKIILGPDAIATASGEKHKRLRRMCGNFFNPEGLRRFVPQMCKIAKYHFKQHWEGQDELELGVMTKKFAFEVACYLFIGMEAGPELDGLNKAFIALNKGLFGFPVEIPGTIFYKAMAGRRYIDNMCDSIMTRRRQELQGGQVGEHKDLLDLLLTTSDEEGNHMSNDAIKDNLVNMLFAGHDTSACTLTMIARMLQHNPHCLEGVIKEQLEIGKGRLDDDEPLTWEELRSMKYTWAVIQETMRIEPTVLGGFRIATEDIEFGGYTFLKGWRLMFLAAASHMQDKFFPDPLKFDPSRFADGKAPQLYTYAPFGGGPRLCLGYEFARIEMLIFIHYVVLNYEFEMVEPDERITRASTFPAFEKGCRIKLRRRQEA